MIRIKYLSSHLIYIYRKAEIKLKILADNYVKKPLEPKI